MRKKQTYTRRTFVGLGGVAAAVAAGSLAGCAASPNTSSSTDEASASAQSGNGDYKAAPAPISDDEVVETLEADIVVIGGGISGAVAAATAVEAGKNVVVFQKAATALSHGSGAAAWRNKRSEPISIHGKPSRNGPAKERTAPIST